MLEIRAGKRTNHGVTVTLVVLGSVALATVIYFGVQVRFASSRLVPEHAALRPPDLINLNSQNALSDTEHLLDRYPPTTMPSLERRRALTTLDAIFHQEDAPQAIAVQDFFHRQIGRAVENIEQTKVTAGAIAWLIYNHGFVVRTSSATICFDLVRAKYLPGFELSEGLMIRIAQQCDVLFVSHVHADHAESFVAQALVDQGKPVVAPLQVGYRDTLYAKVTHLEPRAHAIQTLPIRGGKSQLGVVVYPGHQGADVDNNVVLVIAPDGITVAHTGDQWEKGDDFEWIDRVAEHFQIDILMPNDWTYDLARMVRGFNPALVLPGHANELGHPVEKRQSYLLSFERKMGSSLFGGSRSVGYSVPVMVMTWGESYHYEPLR